MPQPTPPSQVTPQAAAPASRMRRPRLPMRVAVTALVLLAVLATAALIHLSWSSTARDNVTDIALQLNREIVGSVDHELTQLLGNAAGVQEALRSILFQGAIAAEDEAKREFVFLSLLRSQPALSWVAFAWPDGRFFGAQKVTEDRINMVEVTRPEAGKSADLRIDSYLAVPGDVIFQRRVFAATDYRATDQPWYRLAVASEGPVWTVAASFPTRRRAAINASTRLELYGQFVGVIDVVIELERLSKFLAGLEVGRTGSVAILERDGTLLAAKDVASATAPDRGMRSIGSIGADESPALAAVAEAIAAEGVSLPHLAEPRRLRHASDKLGGAYYVALTPLSFGDWIVATSIPEADFLDRIERDTRRLAYMLAALALAAAAAATLLADRLIVSPLGRIAAQLRHIESFRLERIKRLPSPLRELDQLSGAMVQMGTGLASFRKYLPAELVRTLVAQGIEARQGGHHETLTVLFADLAGFTGLSERLGERVVPVLGRYLSLATSVVVEHRGTIDKFIGDAVMAFWGAPLANPGHAIDACRAALALRNRMADLGREHPETAGLKLRIGLNTGSMLVGNIGSEERLSYTVIGDAVNLASRLEGLNKLYGTEILIGEATRRAAGEAIIVREIDTVAVYGRSGATAIYELVAMAEPDAKAVPPLWIARYERGLAAYRGRRWEDAIAELEAAAAARGEDDPPSRILAERAHAFRDAPPPADWGGVEVLDRK